MADNLTLPATSAVILTDDCTTGHAQIIKLGESTNGGAGLIPASTTDGLSVNLVKASVSPPQHANGYTLTGKTVQYTTAQTETAIWTPASGKKIVVTNYQIQAYGTTAGAVTLWFGGSADTTYTRGTDLSIFDGEFAPSSTNKPGVALSGTWMSATANDILRVTSSTAISITITIWGYEV